MKFLDCAIRWRKPGHHIEAGQTEAAIATLGTQSASSRRTLLLVGGGFKQVKWIKGLELVADFADIGGGYGGYHQDHEFFGYRQFI